MLKNKEMKLKAYSYCHILVYCAIVGIPMVIEYLLKNINFSIKSKGIFLHCAVTKLYSDEESINS